MDEFDSYLTIELLSEVLAEFDWPLAYSLEDDMPDGIIMSFPNSNFVFMDGMNGQIVVGFLPDDTKSDLQLDLFQAMLVFVPESERSSKPLAPGLVSTLTPFQSLENTKNGIRNWCILMLIYLADVIHGDFSWVQEYEKLYESQRRNIWD